MKLILGDALNKLKTIKEDFVDLIVTDPPYQLSSITKRHGKDGASQIISSGFMGKKWDVLPTVEIWKECLRVLKPGAFAFVMCTPRQDSLSRMIVNLGDAGFVTGFTSIYWTYATGFPKAHNIGKKIEKMEGAYGGFQPKPAVEIIIVVMKPMTEKTYIAQVRANEKGCTWLGDCRIPYQSLSDTKGAIVGFNNDNEKSDVYQLGHEEIRQGEIKTEGRFPANLLVSDDVLKTESRGAMAPVKSGQKGFGGVIYGKYKTGGDDGKSFHSDVETGRTYSRYFSLDAWARGRFAANLLVSDNVLNNGKVYKQSTRVYRAGTKASMLPGGKNTYKEDKVVPGWEGTYSEYFSLDAWAKTFPFLIVPKAGTKEKEKGLEQIEPKQMDEFRIYENPGGNNPRNRGAKKRKNFHPTIKPIKLMSYLITLGSREGDLIIDPFMGSGTTGIACKLLNRDFTGIEIDEEYYNIAKARINANLAKN